MGQSLFFLNIITIAILWKNVFVNYIQTHFVTSVHDLFGLETEISQLIYKKSIRNVSEPILLTWRRNLRRLPFVQHTTEIYIVFLKVTIFKFPFQCPAFWTECSSHDYGCWYFCSIEKPLKGTSKYFDWGNCKIPKVSLANLDYRLEENCSTSTQTTEGESDRDYTYEEANRQNFK